jgi:serine protease
VPAQPDSAVQPNYQGDYDYHSSFGATAIGAWTDGRTIISGTSQQDVFVNFVQGAAPTATPTATVAPSPTPTATPTATPTPSQITLTASGRKVHGIDTVDLSWSGATSANVDIYRNGGIIATVPNTPSSYTDSTGQRGHATFTYKVCEAGTQNCSNQVTVTF